MTWRGMGKVWLVAGCAICTFDHLNHRNADHCKTHRLGTHPVRVRPGTWQDLGRDWKWNVDGHSVAAGGVEVCCWAKRSQADALDLCFLNLSVHRITWDSA